MSSTLQASGCHDSIRKEFWQRYSVTGNRKHFISVAAWWKEYLAFRPSAKMPGSVRDGTNQRGDPATDDCNTVGKFGIVLRRECPEVRSLARVKYQNQVGYRGVVGPGGVTAAYQGRPMVPLAVEPGTDVHSLLGLLSEGGKAWVGLDEDTILPHLKHTFCEAYALLIETCDRNELRREIRRWLCKGPRPSDLANKNAKNICTLGQRGV